MLGKFLYPGILSLFKLKWQLIVSVASILAMLLSIALMALESPYSYLPLWFVIVMGGIPLCLQIFYTVLRGDFGADLLAVIALITAVILKEYHAANLIILMLSGGQALESYAVRKASSVLASLVHRMPSIVHRKVDGKIEDIQIDQIAVGDSIVVYPHETCPVDGTVIEGHGGMDESYLTGEPYNVSKAPGASVLSGAINGETLLIVQAEKLPSDSRFAAIVKVLQDAEQKRPKLRRLGDQIGAIFAPIALVLALLTWYFTGDAVRFLSVLVIATPCPLLIAIPITIISAISMAARESIIIKDPTVLERLPTCRTAIFDKTGTLTYGKPTLTKILTAPNIDEQFILQQVASLERYSKHPLASAILKATQKNQLPVLEAARVLEKPGHGLSGVINNNIVQITNRKRLLDSHPELSAQLQETYPGLECIILYNDEYAATFIFQDMPRSESQSFIRHLFPSHQFNKVMLVSGDREAEVHYFGKLLNLSEIHASVSPEKKLEIVRAERQIAPTLFMGDGINDAPALTAATVGIAFGQYSDVTAEASGAVIMENNLRKVDELIHLSMTTRQIALQSAIGGMALSLIGMGFAMGGFITPVAGALLQEVIDILAILNALRLTWQKGIDIDLPES